MNTDYKLFTHVIADRLRDGMTQIISDTQSGFLRDPSVHNLRLVLDLLDYRHLIEDDGVILFLDFYKAIDMVEHPFIIKTLECFVFAETFLKIIEMLYDNINSSVSLPCGTSKRSDVNRGIRQGCPSSPLLFITVAY